jgi:hypothetical protein
MIAISRSTVWIGSVVVSAHGVKPEPNASSHMEILPEYAHLPEGFRLT